MPCKAGPVLFLDDNTNNFLKLFQECFILIRQSLLLVDTQLYMDYLLMSPWSQIYFLNFIHVSLDMLGELEN